MSPTRSPIRHETPLRAQARRAARHRHARGLCGIAALALSLWSAEAAADTTVAGDLDYAAPIDSNANSGWGFGIRLGQQLHVPAVVVNPELGFTYHRFADDSTPRVYRGIAGLRIGLGEILRMGPFAHIGVGRLSLSGAPDSSHTAFTYDAGLFLDFTVIPFLNVGVHGAYNRIVSGNSNPAFQFATVGAHAALVF